MAQQLLDFGVKTIRVRPHPAHDARYLVLIFVVTRK
jgi:hypothetical protein